MYHLRHVVVPELVTFAHLRHMRAGAAAHPLRLAAVALLAAAIVAAALVTLPSGNSGPASSAARQITSGAITPGGRAQRSASAPGAATTGKPNIVFVLTDDLSRNLMTFMPHVQSMERSGLTFRNFFVSDSLCCPSRSSIFTGNFPHDTHVFNNVGKMGGFHVFHQRGEERQTFAVALKRAGYRTGMMGKYLNGYLEPNGPGGDPAVAKRYVPPGWSTWDVAGWGYSEFNYTMNENGRLHHYGHAPADYLTDVLARKGVQFINRSAASGHPFFLELATFAPHRPYTPAPRNLHDFPYLRAPRPPNFDRLPTHAPSWLSTRQPLTAADIAKIDHDYRLRAEAVQSVDQMIGRVEQTLAADGITRNTYIIFSSDNGLHMGQYRLRPGKLTAFETDIHVPLVVVGPGVPAHRTTAKFAENIDLGPTFAALGGTTLPSDGRSLVTLLHGAQPHGWANAALVEHRGPVHRPGNPDYQGPGSGNPPSYEALRGPGFLYVDYLQTGEQEYYNLMKDPFELHNIIGRLSPKRLAQLHRSLTRLRRCHTGRACWRARHVTRTGAPRG